MAGPAGPAGPSGPTGPQGAAGESFGWGYIADNGNVFYPSVRAGIALIPGPAGAAAEVLIEKVDLPTGAILYRFDPGSGARRYASGDCSGDAYFVPQPELAYGGRRSAVWGTTDGAVQVVSTRDDAVTSFAYKSSSQDAGTCQTVIGSEGILPYAWKVEYEVQLEKEYPAPITAFALR